MNIQSLIDDIKQTVRSHELGNGKYARYLLDNDVNKNNGNNEYGCADAANILYTIGAFGDDVEKRQAAISAIQDFQHENGLFDEGTHHPIHCTAHCIAALELFDAKPKLPLVGLRQYTSVEGLYSLLESLPWAESPWPSAHQGAGIYAALTLNGNATREWQNKYFEWITDHTDKKYGIGLQGAIDKKMQPVSHHLNGWFHYMFNFVFARRPIPCAKQAVDTCIELYKNKTELVPDFFNSVNFAQIDWIYMLNRAARQEGYRVKESCDLIKDFARIYIDYLNSIDKTTHERWNDLHLLFGSTCALAELQMALPGEIDTDYPLKLVLDRRPFI